MIGSDSPQGAPVESIRSKTNCSIEHQAVSGLLDGSISEDGAVQDLPGDVGVARHDDSRVAEAVGHEAAGVACGGGGGDAAVGEGGGHERDAAQEREASGTRNHGGCLSNPGVVPAPSRTAGVRPVEEGDDKEEEEEEEEGAGEVIVGAFGG